MTLKELKVFIKDLPEMDHNGEEYEVWIGNENTNLSNCATRIENLNRGDILISFKV